MTEKDNIPDYRSMEEFDVKYSMKVMLILAGLVMIVMYIEGMLTPSLLSIEETFGINTAQASLILSLYMVGGVAATPVVGKLGDLYGKKKVLILILIIYAVSVSVTGFSPNYYFMLASRTIQGTGMSVMPLGMALVREEFPREMIPKAQAIISAMFGAGFAVSLPLGSLVSNDFGWRWTYHSAIPVIALLVLVSFLVIKESRFRKENVRIDFVGAVLLAITLSLFVLALSEGNTWGWASTLTLGLVIAGLAVTIPLTIYELRYSRAGRDPILNFRLLAIRNVMVGNIILSLAGLGMFLAMFGLIFRFEYVFFANTSNYILNSGLSMVPFALGTIIFGPIAGVLVTRTGIKPMAALGAIVASAGFVLQATLPDYTLTLVYEFITGAGLSLMNGTLINFIVLTVDPRDMGLATGMNGTFRSLGSSVGPPIAGSILTAYAINTIPTGTAFSYTFLVAGLVFIVAAALVAFGNEVLGKGRSLKDARKQMM